MLKDLRALVSWIDGRTRFHWLLLLPLTAAAAIIEAMGAIAVFGLLRVVAEPGRVMTTPVLTDLWQQWPNRRVTSLLVGLIVAVATFYVARAVFLVWVDWVKESVVHRSGAKAAERLFSLYLAADYAFHLRRRSSSMIEEVARSTDAAFQLIAASALHMFAEVATLAALVTVLLVVAPTRAVIVVVVVLAVVSIPVVLTRRIWIRWGERNKRYEEQQLHVLQQSLGAIKEVKITGRESFFENRHRLSRRALSNVRRQRASVGTALRLGVETAFIVSMLLVVLIVTLQGDAGGDVISIVALFAYTGFRAVPSANRIMLNAGYLREGRPFARAVAADFSALRSASPRYHGPEPSMEFNDSISCEDVDFTHEEASRASLSDVNLSIRKGESIGIVGPTGSGKSTLVDVLLGLLRPTKGRVLIDGHDLRGCERAWQRLVGYVPQEPYLLDDTVRRNVAFGVPDGVIDERRLTRACTLAQLDDLLRQLAQGLDTVIGEHGMRLSGGQRQRVAIARALYHDPPVLVFDEATAALDNQTERDLKRAIAALHGMRTVIVVAHRLSTVEGCDRLLFLQDGRIAAAGHYEQLLRNPAFRAMAAHP